MTGRTSELISKRTAAVGLVGILSMLVVFHLLVLLRVVPFEVIWGGRLKDVSEMITFETISIAISLLMLAIAGVAAGYLRTKLKPAVVKVALWLMFGLFLLNTVGNLISTSRFEHFVFAPLTLILSGLALKLVRAT